VTILSFLSGLNNEINLLIIISLISLLNRGESVLLYVQFSVSHRTCKHLVLRLPQIAAVPLFAHIPSRCAQGQNLTVWLPEKGTFSIY